MRECAQSVTRSTVEELILQAETSPGGPISRAVKMLRHMAKTHIDLETALQDLPIMVCMPCYSNTFRPVKPDSMDMRQYICITSERVRYAAAHLPKEFTIRELVDLMQASLMLNRAKRADIGRETPACCKTGNRRNQVCLHYNQDEVIRTMIQLIDGAVYGYP